MAQINLCKNPLNSHELERYNFNGALIDWLQEVAPQGFGNPIRAFINEEELELQNLDKDVTEDDTVLILVMPATGAEIGTFLWQMIASMAVSYVVGQIFAPKQQQPYGDGGYSNPVYDLNNPKNKTRVNDSIPIVYGEVVTTPDYASEPYYSFLETEIGATDATLFTETFQFPYIKNNSRHTATIYGYNNSVRWFMALFCVGYGEYDVLKTLAGDVEIFDDRDFNKGYETDVSSGISPVRPVPSKQPFDFKYYKQSEHLNTNGIIASDFNASKAERPSVIGSGARRINRPLFHENIINAIVFSGIKLNDIADTEFETGEYRISDDKPIKEVHIDLSFYNGFYFGGLTTSTTPSPVRISIVIKTLTGVVLRDIVIEFKYRPTSDNIKYSQSSTDPRNRTFIIKLDETISPYGPVTLNIKRLTEEEDESSSKLEVVGVKGVIHVDPTNYQYGNVTLLAMRIMSSEFTSQASRERIRSRIKRINLPKGVDGTTNITTSNPADIIYDIWNNEEYGAGRTDDNTFDKALLTKLKAHWSTFTGGEDGFNAVFNQKTTVFEAMETTANFVASDLLMIGSELSLAYENKKEVRRQLFSMANIVEGSFKINYKWDRVGEPDGITIEYLSHDLFEPSFVTWPATATDPRKVKLFGCTSPSYALNYAKYLYKKQILDRKTISFSTELEGLIPRVGDRIGVSHDLADWGISGNLIDYDSATRTFTLDKDLDYTLGSTCQIVLRTEFGTPYPDKTPMSATVIDSNKVKIGFSFPFPVDGYHYAVAKTAQITTDFIVSTISSNEYTVDITAALYVEDKYIDTLPFMKDEVK